MNIAVRTPFQIRLLFLYDPGDVLAHARYLDPESGALMHAENKERRRKIKQRQRGEGPKKQKRESRPIPTIVPATPAEIATKKTYMKQIERVLEGVSNVDEVAEEIDRTL